jgi:hypothetical protein
MAVVQVSQWCMDPVRPERRGYRCAWVQRGAVAWHSLRCGEPGRMEQWLCSPTGQGFGRLAVLVLDHGVKKPSTI